MGQNSPAPHRLCGENDKGEAADLSPAEKRMLKKAIQAELAVRGRK